MISMDGTEYLRFNRGLFNRCKRLAEKNVKIMNGILNGIIKKL